MNDRVIPDYKTYKNFSEIEDNFIFFSEWLDYKVSRGKIKRYNILVAYKKWDRTMKLIKLIRNMPHEG